MKPLTHPYLSQAEPQGILHLNYPLLSIPGLSVLLALSGLEAESSRGESTIVKGRGRKLGSAACLQRREGVLSLGENINP